MSDDIILHGAALGARVAAEPGQVVTALGAAARLWLAVAIEEDAGGHGDEHERYPKGDLHCLMIRACKADREVRGKPHKSGRRQGVGCLCSGYAICRLPSSPDFSSGERTEVAGCASVEGTGVRVALGVLVGKGKAVGNSFGTSKVGVRVGWISTVCVDVGSTVASGSAGTGVGITSAPLVPQAASNTAIATPAMAVRGSRILYPVAKSFFNNGRSTSSSAKWPGRLSYPQSDVGNVNQGPYI